MKCFNLIEVAVSHPEAQLTIPNQLLGLYPSKCIELIRKWILDNVDTDVDGLVYDSVNNILIDTHCNFDFVISNKHGDTIITIISCYPELRIV